MKSWLMGERKIWWLLCRGLLLVGLSKGRMIGKKGRMDEQVNKWSGGSCSSFLQGEPMGQKSCCCYCCCRCCAAGYSDNNNNMFTLSSSSSSSSSLFFTSPLPKIMVHFFFYLYLFGFLIFQPCVSFCRRYQMEERGGFGRGSSSQSLACHLQRAFTWAFTLSLLDTANRDMVTST